MKVNICLTSDVAGWLVKYLARKLEVDQAILVAMENDSELDWDSLLRESAEVHQAERNIELVRGLIEGSTCVAEQAPPTLLQHCEVVYNAMLDRASSVKEGNVELVVYEGALTNLVIKELEFPNPYYTSLTRALAGMGCVRQLRRGGGGHPSQWELLTKPTLELWQAWEASLVDKEAEQDPTQQQLADLNRRLLAVEQAIGVAS
jgi:hypothetical protein